MSKNRDLALGMGSSITRRDFLNGCAVAAGASLAATSPGLLEAMAADVAPEKDPSYYPPAKTGNAREPRRLLGSSACDARRKVVGGCHRRQGIL